MYECYENWEEALEQTTEERPIVLFDTMEGNIYAGFASLKDALALALSEDLRLEGKYWDEDERAEARTAVEAEDVGYFGSLWWVACRFDDQTMVMDSEGTPADPRTEWFAEQGITQTDPRDR